MENQKTNFSTDSKEYLDQLRDIFSDQILTKVEKLASHLYQIWEEERNLFICGNGGSAANAIHIANDLHYGLAQSVKSKKYGIVECVHQIFLHVTFEIILLLLMKLLLLLHL